LRLPLPRGPLSSALFRGLRDEGPMPRSSAPASDADLHISLWALYEQHYRGFDDVDPAREWDPAAIRIRCHLESIFESRLRDLVTPLVTEVSGETDLVAALEHLAAAPGPSLAAAVQRSVTREQFIDLLALRSLYHLKESDPHAWALPRLNGRPKAALVEILYDEFGAGDAAALHQQLYADAMASVGLDPSYGAYVDLVPAHTLAVNNAMSLFGLHRRLRGACLGHLATFEMTSSLPARRFVQGANRLGLPAAVIRYYDEHVEADAVHEQIASRDLCAPLVAEEPALRDDVLFGAAACILLDQRATAAVLEAWSAGVDAIAIDDPPAA
jgi:hypothetical protein